MNASDPQPPRPRIAILGGSGYTGGELLRILLDHPGVEVSQVCSRSRAGAYIHASHPNLRGRTLLRFDAEDALVDPDVLFLCLPHGEAVQRIEPLTLRTRYLIDLSADFRLRDAAEYQRWYGQVHAASVWLDRFVYGLPELHRDRLRGARLASGVGCNATVSTLALLPLARAGLIERAVLDLKVGSSEGGAQSSAASHHPERAGSLRSFAPVGHRHQAEIIQELGPLDLHFSITSTDLVRGVLCTAHVFPTERLVMRDLWDLYREAYRDEPFIRLVREQSGIHRYPDPKVLAGSNWCDIGFEIDERTGRIVVLSAIDNLVKGAAGSAVQCMNLMLGLEETAGLRFPGLHPL